MNTGHELDFCLLIPCYNNFQGLTDSLRTVCYPIQNYLVVVVDDGSDKPVVVEDIQAGIGEEKPIIVLRNTSNLGITRSLNHGLSWIQENVASRFIARLDCGDLCVPDRFTIQVQYLDTHPETGLLGSWCRFREKNSKSGYSYTTPQHHEQILKEMHFRNVFIHPTTMFRVSLLKTAGYYPAEFEYAEDYAFFWKLIKLQQAFVINKFLVTCELNKEGLSFKNRGKQLAARWRVVKYFSTNKLMRLGAFIKLGLLLILPKELTLRLKKLKG